MKCQATSTQRQEAMFLSLSRRFPPDEGTNRGGDAWFLNEGVTFSLFHFVFSIFINTLFSSIFFMFIFLVFRDGLFYFVLLVLCYYMMFTFSICFRNCFPFLRNYFHLGLVPMCVCMILYRDGLKMFGYRHFFFCFLFFFLFCCIFCLFRSWFCLVLAPTLRAMWFSVWGYICILVFFH